MRAADATVMLQHAIMLLTLLLIIMASSSSSSLLHHQRQEVVVEEEEKRKPPTALLKYENSIKPPFEVSVEILKDSSDEAFAENWDELRARMEQDGYLFLRSNFTQQHSQIGVI